MNLRIRCPDEASMRGLGARLAPLIEPGPCRCVHLHGNLGAGKTTLVRGVLAGLGYTGPVRSPTYALVERYGVSGRVISHFDLYRLADPEELEFLGWRDLLDESDAAFFEWPERGLGVLAPADLEIHIDMDGAGREVRFRAGSRTGQDWVRRLAKPSMTV